MKAFLTAIIGLMVVIGASIYEQCYLNNTFKEFESAVEVVYYKTENQTAKKDDILSVQDLWIEKKRTLHIFIPHNDIKEIDLWVSEAVTLIENKKYQDALSKLEVVLEIVEQIPKTYSLKLENIL